MSRRKTIKLGSLAWSVFNYTALALLAANIHPALKLGWHFWSAVVICGAAALLAAVVAAAVSACVYFAGLFFSASRAGSRT